MIESSSHLRAINVTTLQGLNKNISVTSMYSCGNGRSNDRRRQRCGSGGSRSATSFFLFPTFAGVRVRPCMWWLIPFDLDRAWKRERQFSVHTPHLLRSITVGVCVARDAIVASWLFVHTYWWYASDYDFTICTRDHASITVAAQHIHKHKHIRHHRRDDHQ